MAESDLAPITVGTAGHIDHGKTTLVRALTGRDTDRLAEEHRRGMSIELGFAELDLGERRLSLVDVPGHERFVRTMIAGASGIDMFLLAVAADDGPMPQTREHLAVLRSLTIDRGVVALTKVDLVDAKARAAVRAEIAELLPDAPMVEVRAPTGAGVERLRAALKEVAAGVEAGRRSGQGPRPGPPVLHVDRVFTVAGRGTVVTGTLWSGPIEEGMKVTLLPSGREARVRSIQVHDRPLVVAGAHQRVALNLAGIDRGEIDRGDLVTVPEADVSIAYRLDLRLVHGAGRILSEARVQVHLGTRDAPARVADLNGGRVQLRLERPLLARAGDRVVVRRIAPPDTLGGGVVEDPSPPRHGPGYERPTAPLEPAPIAAAPPRSPTPFARSVLAALREDGARPRGAVRLAADLGSERAEVEVALGELAAAGAAVRAKRDVVYAAPVYRGLADSIVALAKRDGLTTIAIVRDELGLSRKYAQALLERLDAERRLLRVGDHHVVRPRAPG